MEAADDTAIRIMIGTCSNEALADIVTQKGMSFCVAQLWCVHTRIASARGGGGPVGTIEADEGVANLLHHVTIPPVGHPMWRYILAPTRARSDGFLPY